MKSSRRRLGRIAMRRPLLKVRVKDMVLIAFCLSLCILLTVLPSIDIAALRPGQASSRLSLLPWLKHLEHRKGFQYTLSFRRPNGRWKNPIKSFFSITTDDLRDIDLPPQLDPSETDISRKDFVLDLLAAGGVTEIDRRVVEALPTKEKFSSLYGPSLVVVGTEHCEKLRKLKEDKELYIGVAGMFNTGTTTLDLYLRENLKLPSFLDQAGFNKEVPWGKHRLYSLRQEFMPQEHVTKIDDVVPIVIIRHPLTWMQSMCTSPYKAKWKHTKVHCPNLVANAEDAALFPSALTQGDLVPAVLTAQKQRAFATLLDLWIEWYAEYLTSNRPRLIVRFEDILVRPDAVVDQVRECLRLEHRQSSFVYVVGPIKWDQKYVKKQSSMVSAIIKYGNGIDRFRNMTAQDLQVAREKLGEGYGLRLSSLFHYFLNDDSD